MAEMRVAILATGLVTAGGDGVARTWESLMAGADTSRDWTCPDGEVRTVHEVAGKEDLFSLAWQAITEALEGTSLKPDALCVGSSSDTVTVRETGKPVSRWGTSVVSDSLAGGLNIDRVFQFGNACASSSYAIATAMDLIRLGRAKIVLAGGVDELTNSSIAGFNSWRVYGDKCRPFAVDRRGLVLADGSAFLVLGREEYCEPLAYLTGAGLVSDAENVQGMSVSGVGRAMAGALIESGLDSVDAVFTHGTGTVANDATESAAIAERWEHVGMPSVVSYKGVLGHPQGASGAISTVLAVEALRRQELFGTVSADKVDPTLAVAGRVTKGSGPAALDDIMVLSHGTWGVYSALTVSSGVSRGGKI